MTDLPSTSAQIPAPSYSLGFTQAVIEAEECRMAGETSMTDEARVSADIRAPESGEATVGEELRLFESVIDEELDQNVDVASQPYSEQQFQQVSFNYRWEYNPAFESARINNNSRMTLIPTIKDALSKEDKQRFNQCVFKDIINMGTMLNLSNQLMHFLLLREVKTKRIRSMWFGINNCMIRFGLREFSDITGLNCGDGEEEKEEHVEMEEVFGFPLVRLRSL